MAQKKSKERPEEPLGTMSYQTSSKRSLPLWLLIGVRKTKFSDSPFIQDPECIHTAPAFRTIFY